VLEDAESNERDDALSVGRNLVHRVAAIIHTERLDPIGLVRSEVGCAHRPFVFARVRLDFLGDRAAVERFPARSRDLLERLCVAFPHEPFARARRPAVRHERLGEAGLALQFGHLLFPLTRDRR
jgi:hypothetical protein